MGDLGSEPGDLGPVRGWNVGFRDFGLLEIESRIWRNAAAFCARGKAGRKASRRAGAADEARPPPLPWRPTREGGTKAASGERHFRWMALPANGTSGGWHFRRTAFPVLRSYGSNGYAERRRRQHMRGAASGGSTGSPVGLWDPTNEPRGPWGLLGTGAALRGGWKGLRGPAGGPGAL